MCVCLVCQYPHTHMYACITASGSMFVQSKAQYPGMFPGIWRLSLTLCVYDSFPRICISRVCNNLNSPKYTKSFIRCGQTCRIKSQIPIDQMYPTTVTATKTITCKHVSKQLTHPPCAPHMSSKSITVPPHGNQHQKLITQSGRQTSRNALKAYAVDKL